MIHSRRLLLHFAASLAAMLPAFAAAAEEGARNSVYVLATLYQRHDKVPAYNLDQLRKIVIAVNPEVLVVDCTPREVQEQKVFPGKIEYPGVIFPLARERRWPVYPAEPDEPLFTEIVQSIITVHESFVRGQPATAAALKEHEAATYRALAAYWTEPARVNDGVTAAALAGKTALADQLYGPVARQGSTKWNRHWADKIIEAAARHRGKRVLALVGVDNRAEIESYLKDDPRLEVVDMPAWLRDHAAR
jgi:hypothetical protein